jgi:hypothetical protein
MRVGLRDLDLADRQPAVALQPRTNLTGHGDDGVAVSAGPGLPGVGDLEFQLVQRGLPPGSGQRRRGQVGVPRLLLG